MKSRIIFIGLFALLLSSCASPKFLPFAQNVDINEHGSYMQIRRWNSTHLKGELIAIDNRNIIILSEKKKQCETIRISEIDRFTLRFAKSNPNYDLSIPIFTFLIPVPHGLFALITAPINFLVTGIIAINGEPTFKYNDREISYDDLRQISTRNPC